MPAPVAPMASAALCPPGAAALGVAGLGSLCQVAGGAAGLAGSAASQVAGLGADSVLGALGGWVSAGAAWLLDQVGAALGATTSVDLGASWFTSHYQTMAALCGVVVVPLMALGVIQAVYRQDLSMLVRSAVVNVPLALVLTAVAVKLVELGLTVTDGLSAAVGHSAGLDGGHFLSGVSSALTAGPGGQSAVPAFVVFLGGVVVVVGAFLVWIELLVRAAAVYVAVLFLPLALASLAWPAVAHWCRRLVDTLVALVLAKFVIVSVLSLAAGALGAGAGGGSGGAGGGAGGFSDVMGGAALLLLAAFAPWALFRLLPFLEVAAVSHLEGASQRARHGAAVPARGLAQTALRSAATAAVGGPAGLLAGAAAGAERAGAGAARSATLAADVAGRGVGHAAGGLPGDAAGRGGSSDAAPARPPLDEPAGTPHPGSSIPLWEGDPEITAIARQLSADRPAATDGGPSGDVVPRRAAGAGVEPVSTTASRVRLPAQTGARVVDELGRDELGVRLVSRQAPIGGDAPGPAGPSGAPGPL